MKISEIRDIFLVDCENVGYKNLDILNNQLVFYFTSNTKHVTIVNENEREVHMNHRYQKNALDNLIIMKLGFFIRHYGKSIAYHIISKDRGFDTIIDYLESEGVLVKRHNLFDYDDNILKIGKILIDSLNPDEYSDLDDIYDYWLNHEYYNENVLSSMIGEKFNSRFNKSERKAIVSYLLYEGI